MSTIVSLVLKKPPFWRAQPLHDKSWKDQVIELTVQNPIKEVDLSILPEEALGQIKAALRREQISSDVETNKILMYNFSKAVELKEKVNKVLFTLKEKAEFLEILSKNLKEIKLNINKLCDDKNLPVLRLLYDLEKGNKNRDKVLDYLEKTLISLSDKLSEEQLPGQNFTVNTGFEFAPRGK
jgi:hypothetical protein